MERPDMTTITMNEVRYPTFLLDPPRGYLGASGIGMCPRKQWFSLCHALGLHEIDGPRPATLQNILKMSRGNYLEGLVVEALEALGFVLGDTLDDQVKISVPLTDDSIDGHPDGVVISCPWGDEWSGCGLEIKTSAPWMFRRVKKDGVPQYYKDQGYLYNEGQDCTRKGRLYVIFDVATGELAFIHEPHNKKRFQELLATGEMIWEKTHSGDPPEISPVADWECFSCPWAVHCSALECEADLGGCECGDPGDCAECCVEVASGS